MNDASRSAEVVIYGGTAGGCVAALAAAGAGASVVLVEPDAHVGGMLTGGLSRTDVERQEPLIGGIALQIFRAIGDRYGLRGQPAWRFEPHVAEAVLEERLGDAGVQLVRRAPLLECTARGERVTDIRTGGGHIAGAVFVDASYEGDLLAAAGASWTSGREDRSLHGESLAGRREILPNPHQFRAAVSALDDDGLRLRGVRAYEEIGLPGDGDGLLQAWCYRICLSSAEDRLPLEPPPGYRRDDYRLLERYLQGLVRDGVRLDPHDVIGMSALPGGKADVNSHGPVSTNLPGGWAGYLEADPPGRTAIAEAHRAWAQGLLHFLAHDAAVPGELASLLEGYGYPHDEFVDTGHWPHQLYIREARRLQGEHVLTEHDLVAGSVPGDTIAMGGYNVDIREVQWVDCPIPRFPDIHREVLVEGYLSAPVRPYGVPYRSLLPRRGEVSNLLVSTCISASAVAFASIRMEPTYMSIGHAAGLAAARAARAGVGVHDLDVAALRTGLAAAGQVLRGPA